MARELVLIPKSKYEHLLKLTEDSKLNEQIGGQRENRDLSTPGFESENKDSREKQMSNSKDEIEKTMEDKPRLYVDKPLSRMPFNRIKLSPSKGKQKKTTNKTKFDGKKLPSGKRKGIKSRWINYTI